MSELTAVNGWTVPTLGDVISAPAVQTLAEQIDGTLDDANDRLDRLRLPSAQAFGSFAVAGPGVDTVATFSSESWDTEHMFSTAANDRILCRQGGIVQVSVSDWFTVGGGAWTSARLRIERTGVVLVERKVDGTGNQRTPQLTAVLPVVAGDYFRAIVTMIGGAGVTNIFNMHMSVQYWALCSLPRNSNPHFDSVVAPWSGTNATLAVSTAFKFRGFSSLQLTPVGGFFAAEAKAELVTANVGDIHTGTAWVYSVAGWNGALVQLLWHDSVSGFLSASAGPLVNIPAGVWTRLLVSATAPAGATNVQLGISQQNTPAATDVLYIDDAQVHHPECLPPV